MKGGKRHITGHNTAVVGYVGDVSVKYATTITSRFDVDRHEPLDVTSGSAARDKADNCGSAARDKADNYVYSTDNAGSNPVCARLFISTVDLVLYQLFFIISLIRSSHKKSP
ncbi:hypothetical protein J6590_011151 [Homalodisca vitripennis]|nr:hypothetical protein J6590_011151 [Homalodisca vitripennis]